jgi:hypothetical protein
MHFYEITEKNSTTRHSFEDHTTTRSKMHTYVWKLAVSILEGNMTKECAVINFMRVAREVSDHHHLVQSPIAVMSSHD